MSIYKPLSAYAIKNDSNILADITIFKGIKNARNKINKSPTSRMDSSSIP